MGLVRVGTRVVECVKRAGESADYFTGNVELGLWWQNDRFVPYMYGIIMPAYLTSAVLIGREKTENTIQNITFGKTTLVNRDLTEKRERSQYFAGGGVGFSFFYGYGMLYCEAQVIYSLRDFMLPDSARLTILFIIKFCYELIKLVFFIEYKSHGERSRTIYNNILYNNMELPFD